MRADELVKQFKAEMGLIAPASVGRVSPQKTIGGPRGGEEPRSSRRIMAVKIEKGGWALICRDRRGPGRLQPEQVRRGRLLGACLGRAPAAGGAKRRSIRRSPLPATGDKESNEVRLRVNIWVGCVGGLVANGGLDTVAGSIYAKKGIKVSFKIIDDWTEGCDGAGYE